MDNLHGSAAERLEQLDALETQEKPPDGWLIQQLRLVLAELASVEPVADAEQARREDY